MRALLFEAHIMADLESQIAALPEWPSVAKGNYPSWENGYGNTWSYAAESRLKLALDWMRGRLPCTTGQCCHELRAVIAACEVPDHE